MKFEFTGRNIEVTPAIMDHAKEHLSKIDKILDSAPTKAHVILDIQRKQHHAQVIVTWRDHVFNAETATADMYVSITRAAEKIEKQARKLKEKFHTRKRLSPGTSRVAPEPVRPVPPALPDPRIIHSRRYRVKPMTPEEAATLVMDSRDEFVVFRDAETSKVGVLYKRKDGNFGLIEP